MDESAFPRAATKRHPTFVTGFVDLDPGLLDVVPGRSGSSVAGWLAAWSVDWLRAVRTVAIDPHQGYVNGCGPASPTPPSSSIRFMPASPTPPSTRSAVASCRRTTTNRYLRHIATGARIEALRRRKWSL